MESRVRLAESSRHYQALKGKANGVWSMNYLKRLEDEVCAWPNVLVHPHRFGGREFRFGTAEVDHAHTGGFVDIPFPRSLCDALLAKGLVGECRWVPDSWALSSRT
jgi:Family of unknown function (DUF5519)